MGKEGGRGGQRVTRSVAFCGNGGKPCRCTYIFPHIGCLVMQLICAKPLERIFIVMDHLLLLWPKKSGRKQSLVCGICHNADREDLDQPAQFCRLCMVSEKSVAKNERDPNGKPYEYKGN